MSRARKALVALLTLLVVGAAVLTWRLADREPETGHGRAPHHDRDHHRQTLPADPGQPPRKHPAGDRADGRIVAAGANVPTPAGATIIDARGKWIAAGIVAGFTNLGLVDAEGMAVWGSTCPSGLVGVSIRWPCRSVVGIPKALSGSSVADGGAGWAEGCPVPCGNTGGGAALLSSLPVTAT